MSKLLPQFPLGATTNVEKKPARVLCEAAFARRDGNKRQLARPGAGGERESGMPSFSTAVIFR